MKKFISMALALVMTLSLCTFVVTPEADAFEDTGVLPQYSQQAIDVIQAIDVMSGYDDNTFQPDSILTRQAAAKIICNMILGPVTAKALPTNDSPFPDVAPGTEWAGYISYCSHEGIINGYSDGLFQPTGPLTGYAFLKMLLGALGYSGQAEGFTDSNWKVNVAKIALGINLNKGITDDPDGEKLADGVTRENAAIYAFNTLQGDLVEYPSQNSININGVTVSMGSGKATPQTWTTSSTSANNINSRRDTGASALIAGTYTGYPIVQFAERYFDKLVRNPNVWDEYTTDDFGRPSIKWTWKGVPIGTYTRDPDAVFVGNVKVNAIYEALRMTDGDDTARLYINSEDPNNTALEVKRSNDKDLDDGTNLNMDGEKYLKDAAGKILRDAAGNYRLNPNYGNSTSASDGAGTHRVDRIGDGCLIECFRNEANNHVDVCVISAYGGKVDSVKAATAKKDRYVTIDYANDNQAEHRPTGITGNGKNEFETEDFAEEDVVAYTYSDSANAIKSMYRLDAESGSLTDRISEKNLRLDGKTYPYAKEYTFNEMTENDLSGKSSYVVYSFNWKSVPAYADWVDDDPRALWIEEDEFSVDQYVLIERITIENRNGRYVSSIPAGATAPSDVQAVVRTSTGARRTYNLDDSKNYRNEDDEYGLTSNAIDPGYRTGRIVRVSSNNNGYRLHKLDDKYMFTVDNFSIEGKTIRQNKTATYNGESITTNNGETLIVDSETHFVVEDIPNETYKSYLGTKNVPDVQPVPSHRDPVTGAVDGKTGATAYVYNRGALAKLVFITQAGNVSSSSRDVTFLVVTSTSNMVESDDGNYYNVIAVDKEQVTTLRIKAGTSFTWNRGYFQPGNEDVQYNKNEGNCILLNKVTYDSNNLVTYGEFDTTKVQGSRAIGIRRVNSGEVRLDTYYTSSYLRDVAENVRVFFCDGDDVEQIDYDDIVNDTKDAIYYVEDDNVITYIFIVNYDGDDVPHRATAPAAPVVRPTVDVDITGVDDTLYAVEVPASAFIGDAMTFRVLDKTNANEALNQTQIAVTITYTDNTADHNVAPIPGITEEEGVWTVEIPDNAEDGTNITFTVDAIAA